MKTYRIIKIIKAKDFVTALAKDPSTQPVEVSLLADSKKDSGKKEQINVIGFKREDDEEDDDSDGGE